jgi:hypothetical protein
MHCLCLPVIGFRAPSSSGATTLTPKSKKLNSSTSASYDLHDKKRVYARNGVREYLVALTYEARVVWFALREGEYEELLPDAEGILRSEVSPGLWLRPAALWQNDLTSLLAVLSAGLASAERRAFVQRLRAA